MFENLEMIVKEAELDLLKGITLLNEFTKFKNNEKFINLETKEIIYLKDNKFYNEEHVKLEVGDIIDYEFIYAKQFALSAFSNVDLTMELCRRVKLGYITE